MRNSKLNSKFVLAVTVLLVSGCTTLEYKEKYGAGNPFAGMRNTPHNFYCAFDTAPVGLVFLPLYILDAPLSLVADVLYLSFDLTKDRGPWSPPVGCPRLHV